MIKEIVVVNKEILTANKFDLLEMAVMDGFKRIVGKNIIYDNATVRPLTENEALSSNTPPIVTESDIPDILSTITEDEYSKSEDKKTLVAAAWEFIWGKKVPTDLVKHKANVLAKDRRGEELNRYEASLIVISKLDTDLF